MKHSTFIAALTATAFACYGSAALAADTSAVQRDYQRLSGKWQLTSAIVNGEPVPQREVRRTILITSGNRFWLPQASGVGTHQAGTFAIDPGTVPKHVDSKGTGGPNAGMVIHGIYEIIDARHQRECFAPPGGARPGSFTSTPGSRRILQYWEKIGPVPKGP